MLPQSADGLTSNYQLSSPFLSVPNFSSFSIVCALPPFFSSHSYSSAIQPLRCPPRSLNLLLTCFICPSPAVLWVPTLLFFFFFVSAGPSRPRAGIWLAIVDGKRANSSKQASAWKQGPEGEDWRMAETVMPDSMRQKATNQKQTYSRMHCSFHRHTFDIQEAGWLSKQ